MATKDQVYRLISSAPHDYDLADGRTLGRGDSVTLTQEQEANPHNRDLIRSGVLVRVRNRADAEPAATKAASKKASELDVDLHTVEGTGADGKITVEDVERSADSGDDNNSEEDDK